MKRLIAVIMSFVVMLVSACSFAVAYADDSYVVKADDVYARQGETVTVPIGLENNKGLMGFRITIRYPDNQLELKNVSSGSITAEGLFNTTITDYYSVKGSFDVLWSDSQENKTDGTLFVMTFKVKETIDDGDYNISVTYSKEDTFNEKFEDVRLSCSPIKVFVGKEEKKTEKPTTAKSKKDGGEKVADDYLISSVGQIMQSFGINSINDVTEEQQKSVIEYVNNRIDSYGSGKKYDSFDELKVDYIEATKNEAARKITESTDPDAIVKAADEVLGEYGAKSFAEIPADKKQEAIDKTLQKLAESGADEEGFNQITSVDDAAEAIDAAVNTAREEKDKTVTPSKQSKKSGKGSSVSKGRIAIISILCIAVALITAITVAFFRRRKHNEI